MKAVSLLALFCVIAFSCSQDESKVAKLGNISFSFLQKAGANSRVSDVGTPASVLLTIKDSNGNAVYENKKLSLFSFGQSYTSESLKMNTGNYTLTQFIVLDVADKALYAAPLQNTVMAKYVSTPLPLSLAVSDGVTTTVTPEVLAVFSDDQPASFGYASFGFVVVKVKQLASIEYFNFNSADFVPVYKALFTYQGNKLTQIDLLDYNSATHSYTESSYLFRKYEYDNTGLLTKGFRAIAEGSELQWVDEYEYDNNRELVKVTEYETNGVIKTPPEYRVIERTSGTIQIKYYDQNNNQYANLDATLDSNGNIIKLKTSSLPNIIDFKYDDKPNPEYLTDLSAEYPFIQQFLSRNNVVSQSNANNGVDIINIEYDTDGYPTVSSNSYLKKIYTYQ